MRHPIDKFSHFVRKIMKIMTFSPQPEALFANSGCKRVDHQVRALINKEKFRGSFEV